MTMTREQLLPHVEQLLADAISEYVDKVSEEQAPWVKAIAPLVVSYATAVCVGNPAATDLLHQLTEKASAVAYKLGIRKDGYRGPGIVAMAIALASVKLLHLLDLAA